MKSTSHEVADKMQELIAKFREPIIASHSRRTWNAVCFALTSGLFAMASFVMYEYSNIAFLRIVFMAASFSLIAGFLFLVLQICKVPPKHKGKE